MTGSTDSTSFKVTAMINGYLQRAGWFTPNKTEEHIAIGAGSECPDKSPDWKSLQPEEQMNFCNIVHRLRLMNRWESPIKIQWIAFEIILTDRGRLV